MDDLNDYRKQFHKYGFCHIKKCVSDKVIVAMQKECNQLILDTNSKDLVTNHGCIIEPTNSLSNGMYSAEIFQQLRNEECHQNPIVSEFISGSKMKQFLCNLLQLSPMEQSNNNNKNEMYVLLFNEQYVVKPSNSMNTNFKLHQDCQYLNRPHLYLSVWMPLDHIHAQNGSIFMVPFARELDIHEWHSSQLLLTREQIQALQKSEIEKKLKIDLEIDLEMKNVENTELKSLNIEQKVKDGSLKSKKMSRNVKQTSLNVVELHPRIGDMIVFTSYTWHKSNNNQSNKVLIYSKYFHFLLHFFSTLCMITDEESNDGSILHLSID